MCDFLEKNDEIVKELEMNYVKTLFQNTKKEIIEGYEITKSSVFHTLQKNNFTCSKCNKEANKAFLVRNADRYFLFIFIEENEVLTRFFKQKGKKLKNKCICNNCINEKTQKNKKDYIRLISLPVETFIPLIQDHSNRIPFEINGEIHHVKMNSQRYHTFKNTGTNCVKCGLKGKFFALEKSPYDKHPYYHFNLYGFDENDNEILFTKDHIIPKSLGGKDHIDNYQTMCSICNGTKGNSEQIKYIERK